MLSASPVWNLLPQVADEIRAGESEWLQPRPGSVGGVGLEISPPESHLQRIELTSDPDTFGRTQVLGTVGVITVEGIITKRGAWWTADLDTLAEDLKEARDDAGIDAIVLDLHTPGGITIGLQEVSELIAEIDTQHKPVVAYADTLCASAGYYLACAAREFYVAPTAITGSVGSVLTVYDFFEMFTNEGIVARKFASGDLKQIGTRGAPVTPEQQAALQAEVDQVSSEFFAHVGVNRGELPAEVFRGGVFRGAQAVAMNLADGTARDLEQLILTRFEPVAAL